MMRLRTHPLCAGDAGVFVHWSVGVNTNGVVEVNVPLDTPCRLAIGEAIAIRTLLYDRKVLGQGLLTGNGRMLIIKSNDILRFVKGERIDETLALHCLYLTHELPEIIFEASDCPVTDEAYGSSEGWHIDQADWRDRRFKLPGELWPTALGPLYITKHVIEQFAARMLEVEKTEITSPKRTLLRYLKPGIQMEKLELSEKEQEHKLSTYGPETEYEIWASPHNRLSFTIIPHPESKTATLVSCYRYRSCQKM